MTSTHKADSGVCSPSTPISSTTGSSGHKNSLKGTKLARRARSFKDDLFEKISQMRTPTNTLGRSHSPHSPRIKHTKPHREDNGSKPAQSLEVHVRQIRNALKHFRDVISKRKLEVLPGNGTVILEIIGSMYADIQSYTLNEHSSTLISATTQVYLSLGKLIKLCDEVLLCEDQSECASLNNENVKEVVDLVDSAVVNLVQLVTEKLKEKDSALAIGNAPEKCSSNSLMRPTIDHAAQRTSLPDIPLTPKERDILEKSNSNPMRVSHSSESILRGSSPPPKPPLPNRANPPPIPPKRRSNQSNQANSASNADLEYNPDSSLLGYGGDQISLLSRSPDDNSSLLSASAGSLDSALNHSREEEELKALNVDTSLEDTFEDDVEKNYALKSQLNRKDASFIRSNRHSNESGFASMQSIRASSVSTKRSSQHSVHSQKSSIASSTDLNSLRKLEEFSSENVVDQCPIISTTSNCVSSSTVSSQLQQQHHQQQKSITSFSSTSVQNNQSTFTLLEQNISSNAINNHFNMVKVSSSNENNNSISNSSTFTDDASGDNFQGPFITEKSINVQSLSSLNKTNSLDISSDDVFSSSSIDQLPPAIPVKTRKNSNNNIHNRDKHISQYDNFEETDCIFDNFNNYEKTELRQHSNIPYQWLSKHQSLMDPPRRCNTFGDGPTNLENPPPLPQKRKNIIAYMEICSSTTRTVEHPRRSYNPSHSSEYFLGNINISHSQTMNLSPIKKPSSQLTLGSSSPISEKPPALPPKNKQRLSSNCKAPPTIITTPPPSPKPSSLSSSDSGYENRGAGRIISSLTSEMSTVNEEQNEIGDDNKECASNNTTINTACSPSTADNTRDRKTHSCCSTSDNTNEEDEGIDVILRNNSYNKQDCSPSHSIKTENMPNLLHEIDISNYLIYKKDGEDGPEIKGGHLDALIVHASRVQKKSDNDDDEEDAFSEAFITTFRTFIQPLELIEKLTHRYTIFCCQVTDQKQKATKETFSLLVRVVNDLTSTDLTHHLLTILFEFVYQLVCSGQLAMAKLLRNKIVEKVTLHKISSHLNEPRNIITNQPTLLDLKSLEIAEQMTLLDAELFQKIEIPEVLLFAKEQCEEKSPNLNKFTEHFNKMSYWARSKILHQMDAKDREKHVIKFIKIMKHLRKMNNYNSYLALLSALDSAPIRRLEWHKTITEGLKEYCALIDSSSSFRVYRQALAETNPPCIPYIGLVLQDLTFVHAGNPDYLKDCIINFSKRWQQHNIIVNMKRFKKCAYPFRRNERIISFFENFENFLGEEQMWQISENIKPRGKRTLQN